ncbi:hypothetical protein TcWFU_003811 [Taenia crassiceps]|uniref:PDZ domain-containing protein n=1 Tax=Taenia crassiceps TaxID=6207 RepID=A0ABR4QGT1_9CEST
MVGGVLRKYEIRRDRNSDPWGFKITTFDNHTFITGVFEHTPAAKAGVEISDVIVTIDNVPCENNSHDEICRVIQKANCHMTLVTRRPRNDEANKFEEITRHISIRRPSAAGDCVVPRYTGEVGDRCHSKPKKVLESNHFPVPKENGDIRKKASRKRRPKSITGLYDISVDESQNNLRRKTTQYEQKKHQSYMNAKRLGDRPTSGVVENGTMKHIHESEGVDDAKTELPKKKSNHLHKSKSEAEMIAMENYLSSTVIKQDEEKVEDPMPPFPSMSDLQRSLPAGKRRTLLLSTGRSLEDRIASLNDL